MTPTQAQIEAAAKAFYERGGRDNTYPWETEKKTVQEIYMGFAKAALTAAAEVGEQEIQKLRDDLTREQGARLVDNMKSVKEIVDLEERLSATAAATAAAEVNKYESRQPGDPLFDGAEESILAAEVGEQEWQHGYETGMKSAAPAIDVLKKDVATIIELCAQVADDYYETHQSNPAAAIRKLKEEK